MTGVGGYADYKECLALEFQFRCVYCLAHQSEVAPGEAFGGYEIEHFRPKGRREFSRFRNIYKNLLWTCHACNHAKGDCWPTPEELSKGYRFADPSAEALGSHLQVAGANVRSIDRVGEFMVDEIDLDSELHQHRRRERAERVKRLSTMEAIVELKIGRGDSSAEILELQNKIASLLIVLEGVSPFDAPKSCLCSAATVSPQKRLSRAARRERRAAAMRAAAKKT